MLSGDVDFQAGKLGEVFSPSRLGCLDPDVSGGEFSKPTIRQLNKGRISS